MTVGVPFLVLLSCLHRMDEIVDADTFEFESLAAGAGRGHRHRSHSWFLSALREFAERCENVETGAVCGQSLGLDLATRFLQIYVVCLHICIISLHLAEQKVTVFTLFSLFCCPPTYNTSPSLIFDNLCL